MRKILPFLALAAAMLPSVIQARGTEQRFTRDGVTYVYTVATSANGNRIVEGHRLPGGSAFRLVISNGHVDGVSGGQPVSFPAPRAVAPLAIAAR